MSAIWCKSHQKLLKYSIGIWKTWLLEIKRIFKFVNFANSIGIWEIRLIEKSRLYLLDWHCSGGSSGCAVVVAANSAITIIGAAGIVGVDVVVVISNIIGDDFGDFRLESKDIWLEKLFICRSLQSIELHKNFFFDWIEVRNAGEFFFFFLLFVVIVNDIGGAKNVM